MIQKTQPIQRIRMRQNLFRKSNSRDRGTTEPKGKGMGSTPIERAEASAHSLWKSWAIATALGELVGFIAPTLAGVGIAALGLPDPAMAVGVTLAGSLEGAALGYAQSLVLRRHLPQVNRRAWVLASALGAVVAYSIGMLPSSIGDFERFSPALLAAGGSLLGLVFLLSMGLPQWFILRRHLPRAGWWVGANALAWPLGVLVPVVGMMLVPDAAPLPVWVAVGILSGLLMGLVVGAITGATLDYLRHSPPRRLTTEALRH